MKIDFNEALQQLADALNTTVEYLYPFLIRQAYVVGFQTVIAWLIPLVILLVVYKMATKEKREANKGKEYDSWVWEDEGIPYIIAMGVLIFISIITTMIMIAVAPTALLNPEYWALKEIIDSVTPN